MKLDPFGHVGVARHFQRVGESRLSKADSLWEVAHWKRYIAKIEIEIKKSETAEMEYQNWLCGRLMGITILDYSKLPD